MKVDKVETHRLRSSVRNLIHDFPGGTVVQNTPVNVGDTGSIPGLGTCHMSQTHEAPAPQLLSPFSRAQEPQLLKPVHLDLCSASREAAAMRSPTPQTRAVPALHNQRKPPRSNKDPVPEKYKRASPNCKSKIHILKTTKQFKSFQYSVHMSTKK